MLLKTMALVIADNDLTNLGDLTDLRSLAAVPFGGRYRIIDFILSSLVNSGINHIGVITKSRYRSLMDHIRTGASWDLDRLESGLTIIPPYMGVAGLRRNTSNLSVIYDYIADHKADYCVIANCNYIYNIDLDDFLQAHVQSKADVTVMYNKDGTKFSKPIISLVLDDDQKIQDMYFNNPAPPSEDTAIGLVVFSKKVILDIIGRHMMLKSDEDFTLTMLLEDYKDYKVKGYETKAIIQRINSTRDYFAANMALLNRSVREAIFDPARPIYTRVKNAEPARYCKGSYVGNSLISDGCQIEGTVTNSILFRGVKVGRHAHIDSSVLIEGTIVDEGVELQNAIIDKGSILTRWTRLIGDREHPFLVRKEVQI